MNKHNNIAKDRMKVARSLAVCCLLLFFMSGSLKAQNPGPHVIKYNDTVSESPLSIVYHYLAHVYNESSHVWELQDATEFSPNCIWISDQTFSPGGTNKNYYFYDENNHPRFLAAPSFMAGGALGISSTTVTATDLSNPEYRYYFYRWDNGLGRGVQYFGVNAETCTHDWKYGECWEVYWVAYEEATGTWKLSEQHYNLSETHDTENPEPRGARYSHVVVTEHSQDTTTTSGGLAALGNLVMEYGDEEDLSASVELNYEYSYIPAYTTYIVYDKDYDGVFHEIQYNYYGGEDHGTTPPGTQNHTANSVTSYRWTLDGDGATYLSLDDDDIAAPTITYDTENTTGDKIALLTLTVTYNDGSKQHSTAEITVKTPCQNPGLLSNPVVTYTDVTVSWYPTATSYKVYWKKSDPNVTAWSSANVGNVTSYVISGLDFGTPYLYKVQATSCTTSIPETYGTFTTKTEPDGLMVFGAVFGGGRMANVDGKTEVVIVNCDSISAIYGGNDIAGTVQNTEGSKITLGVDDDGVQNGGYDDLYGTSDPTKTIRIGSVYGGGNGYYSYGSTDFAPIGASATTASVGAGASVYALSKMGEWNVPVWTNETGEAVSLTVPSITKTKIVVTNNCVKTDSIFGGAKNAFLTASTGNGSDITIDGGTHLAVFGGNNVGGSQGDAKQYIEVNKTTINLVPSIENSATEGYGRDFGIRYLFGGGNKVLASGTDVLIQGGQLDTIFAGGNSADVAAAQLRVNCNLGAHTENTYIYGNTYTNAINNNQYRDGSFGNKAIDTIGYHFDGFRGIYNVRTLFGGNNQAAMNVMPEVTLTSGSVGTVYGGGNAGDMKKEQEGGLIEFDEEDLDDLEFIYSTHVVLNSDAILVDYLYGGCQMSNVEYSTWVELQEGHVGTVYGGCNVSGDVGSTKVFPEISWNSHLSDEDKERYQTVQGATYVKAGGYTDGDDIKNVVVYQNLFAGSNGYYDCSSDGIHYNNDDYFDDQTGKYEGLTVPTHNETHAVISAGARVRENVYAGGNLACVGFDDGQGTYDGRAFPELVGLASVRMDGGRVEKNVYGGCNMSSIYGTNEVRVSGGYIGLALYGGNDRSGQVAEKTNRFLPDEYLHASDNYTSLTDLGVKTYVGVKGSPQIGTVYGGGNGAYAEGEVQYCSENYHPIQSYTFVDIHINGGANGGHIGTVYGGGNGVTVRHGVTVFLNVQSPNSNDGNHVDTIFGGNNKGNLDIVPDILLVHGKVGTVYGGCNQGAMVAEGNNTKAFGDYDEIGSYVRLLKEYVVVTNGDTNPPTTHTENVTAEVTEAVYGGCRMNGVTNNSLVLVEGGNFFDIPIFGGSDVGGHIGGWSRVAVTDGIVGDVYGGGNGNYYYADDHHVYKADNHSVLVASNGESDPVIEAPTCANSGADILGGQVGASGENNDRSVFGGGLGEDTSTTGNVEVNVGPATASSWPGLPIIYGDIYGGSALGTVNTNGSNSTIVNFLNGTLHGKVFGGGLGQAGAENVAKGRVYGKVTVNIGDDTDNDYYIDLRYANVFGCNNTNGSPQDDVTVHVWKTAYNFGDYTSGDNYTSQNGTNGDGAVYAINQVFGGGNKADYNPLPVSEGEQHKTLVFVHDCLNTIGRVFSGGNAAAASCVATVIQGGRFNYIFGGGNGEVDPADIGAGGTDLVVAAGIVNHLFGGSNSQGSILGPVNTEINASGIGESCSEDIVEFFGGSNQAALGTSDDPATIKATIFCGTGAFHEIYGGSKLADIIGNVTLNVRGGTCTGEGSGVYGGSKGQPGNTPADAADITGNVTLNLEGGTITNAFGGSNVNGNITGNIIVNVIDFEECPLDVTNVFGGGNQAEYKPTDPSITSPLVNVMHIKQAEGVRGNVFGGGNEASVMSRPRVNIGYNATAMQSYLPADLPNTITPANFHTYVTGNVFGGGNNITVDNKGVEGNTTVYVYNGQVCQSWGEAQSVGIYGGCNTSGTVTGNVHVTILGGTVGNTTTRANIHGGGFGEDTDVHGSVTVTFGEIAFDNSGETEIHTDYPKLYGDLYGGSALGNVNTNNSQNTEVNILNGEITGIGTSGSAQYGYVFGGGLGRQADTEHGITAVEAQVKGVVRVNIGEDTQLVHNNVTTFRGMANLMKCMVFGCNNKNGTPLANVYVDVYKTSHPETSDDYAIVATYGCGNQSDYAPNLSAHPNSKAHVYVHSCDNTIRYVYGGGEASAAYGVETLIEGGRFGEIYGGGNGIDAPANIGLGGIGINVNSGHVNFLFEGSNHHGSIADGAGINIPEPPHFPPAGDYIECEGELVIDSYYFGDNEAEHYGDLVGEITCEQADHFNYKYVFAGSRWAIVYGDIKLTVKGGNIQYLFGGSKGDAVHNLTADVRRFPSSEELAADAALPVAERKYSDDLKAYMGYPDHFKSELVGRGGNIVLTVQGGTIGDIVGGCDELGNVEGKITVIIDEIGGACPLVIGNIYGASNRIDYEPINDVTHHAYFEPGTPNVNVVPTPQVKILKGTVGSDSPVTFSVSGETLQMEGNVFGGGNIGNITANPKVIVGESTNTNHVEIKGDVYGGGKQGNVNGNAGVIVVPTTHTLTITPPTEDDCVIMVTSRQGNTINSGAQIDEYQDLNLLAVPSAYGYKFDHWDVTNGSVLFEKASSTLFTMGTDNATLKAIFTTVSRYDLTLTTQGNGTVAITDGHGHTLTDYSIGEGAVLNLVATPADGYAFLKWEVTGSGSSVANVNAATTTFTMGAEDVTLTAVFVETHPLTFSAVANGTVSVTDIQGHPVHSGDAIGAGATLYIVGTPDEDYIFDKWTLDPESGTITDRDAASTTYIMGNVNVELRGSFKLEEGE